MCHTGYGEEVIDEGGAARLHAVRAGRTLLRIEIATSLQPYSCSARK